MKVIASIPSQVFYNPAASLPTNWYGQARPGTRRKTGAAHFFQIEPEGRQSEVVCSVILTVCLLVAFAHCVVQFAFS